MDRYPPNRQRSSVRNASSGNVHHGHHRRSHHSNSCSSSTHPTYTLRPPPGLGCNANSMPVPSSPSSHSRYQGRGTLSGSRSLSNQSNHFRSGSGPPAASRHRPTFRSGSYSRPSVNNAAALHQTSPSMKVGKHKFRGGHRNDNGPFNLPVHPNRSCANAGVGVQVARYHSKANYVDSTPSASAPGNSATGRNQLRPDSSHISSIPFISECNQNNEDNFVKNNTSRSSINYNNRAQHRLRVNITSSSNTSVIPAIRNDSDTNLKVGSEKYQEHMSSRGAVPGQTLRLDSSECQYNHEINRDNASETLEHYSVINKNKDDNKYLENKSYLCKDLLKGTNISMTSNSNLDQVLNKYGCRLIYDNDLWKPKAIEKIKQVEKIESKTVATTNEQHTWGDKKPAYSLGRCWGFDGIGTSSLWDNLWNEGIGNNRYDNSIRSQMSFINPYQSELTKDQLMNVSSTSPPTVQESQISITEVPRNGQDCVNRKINSKISDIRDILKNKDSIKPNKENIFGSDNKQIKDSEISREITEQRPRYSCQIGKLKHVYPPPGMEHMYKEDYGGIFLEVPEL